MDAIKKKMLAMKMEKENAVDRAEQNEQKLRDTEEQKAKIEEDLNNLQKKCANLENDFDNVNEQLQEAMAKLETSEKRVTEDPNEETVEGLETSENSAQSSVSMGESLLSVEPEYSGCVELSQESQISTQDLSQGSTDIPLTTDGAKPKKKKSSKKVKKKKDKDKDKSTKDKSEKSSKSKSGRSSSRRPEPEGGNAPASYVDDYERIIYSNDALFSDVEITDEDYANFNKDCRKPHRANRQGRDGAILIPCTQLGINSNTMIKFAIIGTELQNVIQVSLKRVGIADIDVHATRVLEMLIGVSHCIYFSCKQIALFR